MVMVLQICQTLFETTLQWDLKLSKLKVIMEQAVQIQVDSLKEENHKMG